MAEQAEATRQIPGAAIAHAIGIRIALLLVSTFGAAICEAQSPASSDAVPLVSDMTIEFIPPLARAVLTGDPKEVSRVLEREKNLDEPVRAREGARAGFTPLILAVAFSDEKIAKMLIERGAKVQVLDDFNRSAVWYAALHKDVALARVLGNSSSLREVVNTADHDFNRTPLHLAVRGNEPEIVDLLVKWGASGTQKDILGETPRDYCNDNPTAACKELPK